MSISVTFNGTTYTIPSPGEAAAWGDSLNTFLRALATAIGPGGGVLTATGTNKALTLVSAAAKAPLLITPQASGPTGPNVVGDLYMTSAGVLKVCTVAGTPGTFVSVGAQT